MKQIWLCSIFLFGINSQISAQQSDVVWEQYHKHFQAGHYMQALHEVKRIQFINYEPETDIYFAIAEVYKAQKNWDSAFVYFKKVTDNENKGDKYFESLYNCQLISYLTNNIANEVYFYKTLQRSNSPDSVYAHSEIISILSDVKVYNWDGAKVACKELFADSTAYWDSVFVSLTPMNLKSPKRALRLSTIPGAGQLYAGKSAAGIQSIILQTGVAAGITFAVLTKSYFMGGLLLAPIYLRLHYGGKLLAYKMVETENENKNRQSAKKLKAYILKKIELEFNN